MVDNGDWQKATEYINQQTITASVAGTSIYSKVQSRSGGDGSEAVNKGLKISLEAGPDGKYEIVEVCKYCDK